ncbi:hypothetical protein QN277_026024 [Acacia crassicarpa]|uniref:Uncharacterized protein n=1 Tax=Acacia crassicarpa TaxID=499986 RepID=A0AAE1MEY4_9FABA|nr:hypothetical protein QN277_026024 [Acacia crassicarpa]
MAPPMYLGCRRVVLFCVISFLFASACSSDDCSETQFQSKEFAGGRRMLEASQNEEPALKKTKPMKANLSLKNQTKTIKSNLSSKNQTKLAKPSSDSSSKTIATVLNDTVVKKLNSTTKNKKLNSTSKGSTKSTSISSEKSSSVILKEGGAKNKTTKSTAAKESKVKADQKMELESEKTIKNKNAEKKSEKQKNKKQSPPSWIEQDNDDDFVSELRDLPNRFQQSIIPDLTKISSTSRIYMNKANKQITNGFKPYVGNKYAPTIATVLSCVFLLIPLVLVSLIFNRIKAYFSLQRLLIFIQVYLSIYFSVLCFVSLITALEPLKFLYATSQTTYVCLQVLQTLGYVLYLLLLVMYLILVFSTDGGPGSKLVGLTQIFVGFAVGLHYYVTVFHRLVLKQAPKTNWKIHGIYATCFLMSCVIARADRRKKAYMEEGGEEGKKN